MTFAIANFLICAETTANTNTVDHVAILRAWCAENRVLAWADELDEETEEAVHIRVAVAEPSRWEALRPCGDHCISEYGVHPHPGCERAAAQREAEAELDAYEAAKRSLWDNSFADDLDMRCSNIYDTAAMKPAAYTALIAWLYANGWEVSVWLDGFYAVPAGLPPREPPKPRAIARFCVKCDPSAPSPSCAYVHDDVIYRLDPEAVDIATGKAIGPCKFGEGCKGEKRATCLRMHPSEVWTPDMAIYRVRTGL
jgi:hypothetical protein